MDDHALTAEAPASQVDCTPPPAAAPAHLRRPAWQLVLALAGPEFVRQLLVIAVQLSDRLLAGRFQDLDPQAQAATQAAQTTAGYLSWFLICYTYLVTVGSTALVARFTGAGDRRRALLVTHQSLLFAVFLGLAGTLLMLAGLDPLLRLLQLQGAAHTYAADYLRPLILLLVFQVVGAAGIACLVGAGDTRTGLWVLGGVAVLNLPLAWGLFHGAGPLPALGFAGIAWGTALSQALGGLVVLAVLLQGRAGLRLRWRLLRPRPELLRRLLRVSVPAAADSLSMQVGYLWFVGIVNGLGDVAAAAHGIALTWEALAYQSGSAFGVAAIALVGQGLGAGRPDWAARSGWTAYGMGALVMTGMGALFFALAGPMFRLFCPHPGQEAIVAAGVPALRLIAFAMPALASCMVLTWALRGAGDTRVPVLFTVLGFFGLRIPLAYLFTADHVDLGAFGAWPGPNLGLFGAWLAMAVDVVARGTFILLRFAGGRWRTMRV